VKEQLKIAQGIYDYCKAQHDVGFRVSEVELFRAKAHLLDNEIKLARESEKAAPPR
jgi:hypothetical protein